jgi:pimeloyl-ACP methyl ester carboxylesterase
MDDGLAVADALGLKQFYTLGVSTGGAYALAFAALHPERVLGAIACCAMTDMRFQPARDAMSATAVRAVWDAADRRAALRVAADVLGTDGSKLLQVFALAPSDAALFQDPEFLANAPAAIAEQFKQGVEGYTDDRIADRDGWIGFDPAKIVCPVLVLQGAADTIVDVIHAKHTAQIVPTARLRLVDQLGHLSIFSQIVPALTELRNEPQRAAS